MKAIVHTKLGPPEVLQVMEVKKPVPREDQVLVKVQAASVNTLEWRRFDFQLKGNRVPVPARLM